MYAAGCREPEPELTRQLIAAKKEVDVNRFYLNVFLAKGVLVEENCGVFSNFSKYSLKHDRKVDFKTSSAKYIIN